MYRKLAIGFVLAALIAGASPTPSPTPASVTCLQTAAQDCLTVCQGTAGACYANCIAIRNNSCNGGS